MSAGYTVRLPYRVDEPKLGCVEREFPDAVEARIGAAGTLELLHEQTVPFFRTWAHVYAHGAWLECWPTADKGEPA
jgi:hypothetical protein